MLLNVEKTILSYIRLHLLKVLHFTYFITTIYIWGQTKKIASFISLPGVCIDLPQIRYLQVALPIPLLHRHR